MFSSYLRRKATKHRCKHYIVERATGIQCSFAITG